MSKVSVLDGTKKRACLVCGELTSGAVGACGLVWPTICPECKAREDRELETLLGSMSGVRNYHRPHHDPYCDEWPWVAPDGSC